VSVTAEHSACIVLCKGADPFTSACYWILFARWPNGNVSNVITRRPNGVSKDGTPKVPCKNEAARKYVSINVKSILKLSLG
jgi:hypothetical protein